MTVLKVRYHVGDTIVWKDREYKVQRVDGRVLTVFNEKRGEIVGLHSIDKSVTLKECVRNDG